APSLDFAFILRSTSLCFVAFGGFRRPVLTMIFTRFAGLTAIATLTLFGVAGAQPLPPGNVPGGSPPPGVYGQPLTGGPQSDSGNSICIKREGALAQLDANASGGPDASKRYEDAIGRQRFELDQTIM